MRSHRSFFQKLNSKAVAALIAASLSAIALTIPASGCGDSGASTQGGNTTSEPGGFSRPAPGVIEMLDARNDVTGSSDISQVPSWADINWASIAQDGGNLIFTLDLAGVAPENLQQGMAAEWGFMLDTSSGGSPDWIVYGSISNTDGWTMGLYNPKTKARLTGQQFPGTISHKDTKVVLNVNASAIASPQSFKWFAFTNYYVKPAGSAGQQAGDKVPDGGVPDSSADWLPYP